MIVLSALATAIVAAVLALWLFAAVAATVSGVRRAALAQGALAEAERLAALLAGAPAIPVRIMADGRIDAGARLADWLGLPQPPRTLGQLSMTDDTGGYGLEQGDLAGLIVDVAGARASGGGFARPVRARGSARYVQISTAVTRKPGLRS